MVSQENHNNLLIEHYSNDEIFDYLKNKITALSDCSYMEKLNHIFKYDQFHIGGVAASEKLLGLAGVTPGSRVLDVGSGLGGVARYFAHFGGCAVVALDLVPSYVILAQQLDDLLAFEGRVDHLCGDALSSLPAGGVFDVVIVSHVGMNIKNKANLFSSIYKSLKDNGKLIIYDVVLSGVGVGAERSYPLPWAGSAAADYADEYNSYKNSLLKAGLQVIYKEKCDQFSQKIIDNAPTDDIVPFTGANFELALKNLRQFLAQGHGAPWVIIAEKI